MTMLPDTPEGRALEFLRKGYPGIYESLRASHPEIVRAAMTRTINPGVNGLGADDGDGILDSILNFAKAAVPVYQQQKVFSAQLKAATQTPVSQIQRPGVIVPTMGVKVPWYKNPFILGGGLLFLGGAAYLLLHRKRR